MEIKPENRIKEPTIQIASKVEAASCSNFQAELICFSSVNGAPIANRRMYFPDKTCSLFKVS